MRRQHRMAIHHCRLRKYRKSAHVSQRELALLVGLRTQGVMSEIESGRKRPGVRVALGCAIVFDAPLRDLFPGLYAEIEREVFARANRLHGELAPNGDRPATTAYVGALLSRLGGVHPPV